MNKKLIEQVKAIARQNKNENISKLANDMTPPFYAAMLIVLNRDYEFSTDDLTNLMVEIGEIWNTHTAKELIEICAEETGIRIDVRKEEKP